jgi:hypothetical protein
MRNDETVLFAFGRSHRHLPRACILAQNESSMYQFLDSLPALPPDVETNGSRCVALWASVCFFLGSIVSK